MLIDVGRYSFSYDFPNFSGYDGIYWVEWIVIKDTGKVIIKEPFIISNMLDRWKEEREEREAELVRRRTSDDKVMGILNV